MQDVSTPWRSHRLSRWTLAPLAAAAAALASAGASAQAVGIVDQPLPATVGAGGGVEFEVRTKLLNKNHRITGHVWRKGKTVVPCGSTARCVLPAVTSADAGDYTVEVLSTGGSTVSDIAKLTVVRASWARLGGRPLSTSATAQQPALALCDQATLAWVDNPTGARSDIRVHRFTGTGWAALATTALNAHTSSDAVEPTIDCASFMGTRQPAVAWSETDGPGSRVIRVKRLDGVQWLDLGVASHTGTAARLPRLRSAPSHADVPAVYGLNTNSSLVWEQGGYGRIARWDGLAWQRRGGWPLAQARQALTFDPNHRTQFVRLQPALSASIDALANQNQAPVLRATDIGFARQIGAAAAPVQAMVLERQIVGVGYGSDAAGSGVFMAWTEGRASYRLHSARLPSPHYQNAMNDPTAVPAWQAAADSFSGTGLRATAFDPTELASSCAASEPAFAAAISDSRGVQVRIADCRLGPWQWRPSPERLLDVAAIQIDLRLDADVNPTVATVHQVGDRFEMSVWRHYP